jgi:outer membrane lipoprotein-sorting protein
LCLAVEYGIEVIVKLRVIIGILLAAGAVALAGQEIVTAERYLEQVSQVYAGFKDYEANIVIRQGGADQSGVISHRLPSFLRIDFSSPANQVLVFIGDALHVYLPEYRAVLTQSVNGAAAGGAGLATAAGLALMRRNYAAAYVTGPEPTPLDGGGQMAVKLRLTRRFGSEGFRELTLSIDPTTRYIRRIEGITVTNSQVRFDFSNIKTNQGIPEQRFLYDLPANANQYNNFLLRDNG